jgi:hypothetical protein
MIIAVKATSDESGTRLREAVERGRRVAVPCRAEGTIDGVRVSGKGRLVLAEGQVTWSPRWGRGGDRAVAVPAAASVGPAGPDDPDDGDLRVRLDDGSLTLTLEPHLADGALLALAAGTDVRDRLAPPVGEAWPVPRPSAARRWAGRMWRGLANVGVVLFAFLVEGGGPNFVERGPDVDTRLRRIRGRYRVLEPALVWGGAGWCPPHPERATLALTPGSATVTQGSGHEIPLATFVPAEVRRAREATPPPPVRVPRRWWAVRLTGPDGSTAWCAADRSSLALLGAVGSWPAPPGWPSAGRRRGA